MLADESVCWLDDMHIRAEQPGDRDTIHTLNAEVFDTVAEARLVDALREQARPIVSLVAERAHRIVGHILFSPVSLSGHSDAKIMGLGPMAVSPEYQHQGIGSALVQEGLDRCRQLGFGAVAVLGHPGYYPRFGFLPASRFGIGCEYDVPEEVFMMRELQTGYLRGRSGTISYHAAFRQL